MNRPAPLKPLIFSICLALSGCDNGNKELFDQAMKMCNGKEITSTVTLGYLPSLSISCSGFLNNE